MHKPIVLFLNKLAGGGTEKVVVRLANYYASKQYRVHLILMQKTGPYLHILDDRVVIHELTTRLNSNLVMLKKILAKMHLLFYLQLISFRSIVKKNNFDKVICFGEWPNIIGPLSKKISIKKSCRLLISERSTKSFLTDPGEYRAGKILIQLALIAYRNSDSIIACSENVKKTVIEAAPSLKKKIVVIHNPIDIDNIVELSKKEAHHPFYDEGCRICIAVGRLHNSKDYPTMLKAFSLVYKTNNLKLMILGDGHLLGELSHLADELKISKHVDFLGFEENPYRFMRKSDLFLHSAIYEGFPNVIIEALSCGLSVVTTDCDGIDEILKKGKYGTIVPKGNYHKFSIAISDAILNKSDPKLQRAAINPYDVSKIAEKYITQ
jgi:glycosyltransferase involved in cell wall biosynthesis